MDLTCLRNGFTFFIIMCLAAVNCLPSLLEDDTDMKKQWELFKLEFNKTYIDEFEDRYRFNIFIDNNKFIHSHNEMHENGLVEYKLGINPFADLTHDEFLKISFGYTPRLKENPLRKSNATFTKENATLDNVPDSFDWRDKKAVTKVKHQGDCNCCWAFSAVGALESQYFIKTGVLRDLSEQNLIDCDIFNNGCRGGAPEEAYLYIMFEGGIDSEDDYPYTAVDGDCHYNHERMAATDSGFNDILEDEDDLKQAVATVGPVSVAMDFRSPKLQFYNGGIYNDLECSSKGIDLTHALVLVGYGTNEKHEDYWIVKNSWGVGWGEKGYLITARNKGNMCGIATRGSYPIVDKV